jgi:hypothetical protein
MASYDFIPYNTLEIGLNFKCINCCEIIKEYVSVPLANMGCYNVDPEHIVNYGDIQCSYCQRNYKYSIVSSGTLQIYEIDDEEISFHQFDLGKEEFKDCPYNYTLKVSQYGNVLNKITNELLVKIIKGQCYIVPDPRGKVDYDCRSRSFEWVHRLVALTWLTDEQYYMVGEVHHRDENGFNNRIDNLECVNRALHNKRHGFS